MGFVIKRKAAQKQLGGKTAVRRKFHAAETVMAAVTSSPAIANDLVPTLNLQIVPIDGLKSAIRRWEQMTGKRAIHCETGLAFEELAATRVRAASAVDGEQGDGYSSER